MSPHGVRPFPLVPRRRFRGIHPGSLRTPQRGEGDETAGSRPYRPGDRLSWIDWGASARLSAARGSDDTKRASEQVMLARLFKGIHW